MSQTQLALKQRISGGEARAITGSASWTTMRPPYANSYTIVFLLTNGTVTGVNYGTTAMTALASVEASAGTLYAYGLADTAAHAGEAVTVTASFAGSADAAIYWTISYPDFTSASGDAASYSISPFSETVTLTSDQIAVAAIGARRPGYTGSVTLNGVGKWSGVAGQFGGGDGMNFMLNDSDVGTFNFTSTNLELNILSGLHAVPAACGVITIVLSP